MRQKRTRQYLKRREQAARLSAAGVPRRVIAKKLGVKPTTITGYLADAHFAEITFDPADSAAVAAAYSAMGDPPPPNIENPPPCAADVHQNGYNEYCDCGSTLYGEALSGGVYCARTHQRVSAWESEPVEN